jgi:hypothetical protein
MSERAYSDQERLMAFLDMTRHEINTLFDDLARRLDDDTSPPDPIVDLRVLIDAFLDRPSR